MDGSWSSSKWWNLCNSNCKYSVGVDSMKTLQVRYYSIDHFARPRIIVKLMPIMRKFVLPHQDLKWNPVCYQWATLTPGLREGYYARAINVTSFSVFHAGVTVLVLSKLTSVYLNNNNNYQINLFNSDFELLFWVAQDYICKGEYQTKVVPNPQHNGERK